MNRLLSFTAFVLLACLAAGPGQAADSDVSGASAAPPPPNLTLQPVRVVYQQVEGTFLKSPRGVWVDRAKQEVYVADTLNDLVAVYDSMGLPLFAFGYNKELKEPTKAIADSRGRIFVLNGIPKAMKVFNYRGEYLSDFPLILKEPKIFPTTIAVDQKGNIYVALSSELGGQIQVYDSTMRLVREFGKTADGNSRLKSVQSMAIDDEGTVFVADASATPCIQVYSPEGTYLRGWGKHDAGPQNFSLPAGLALDAAGRVIVVDTLRQTIAVFANNGDFLGRFGGFGRQPGNVAYPTDIAAGADDRLFVVEGVGTRLQILQQRVAAPAGMLSRSSNPADQALRQQMRRQSRQVMEMMK